MIIFHLPPLTYQPQTLYKMLHECRKPVPCTTPMGDGYIWYIKDNGMFENDEFTVVLCDDGCIRHFTSDQIKIWTNATYGIKKDIPF